MDLDERGGGRELEGVERGETGWQVLYEKRIFFLKKESFVNISSTLAGPE